MAVVTVEPSVVAGTTAKEEETMLIKKSCNYRAKYQTEEEAHISPLQVVPHPMNRGGDPVKVLRCRSITAQIAYWGCDVKEAQENAVLIESPPDEAAADEVRQALCNPDFDAHFAEQALDDKDMCIKYGSPIVGGSASHSHGNCTLRNAATGKVGCECPRTPVVAGGAVKVHCTCGNACICDDNGRYSMAKIRARDPDWEGLILRGLKWQKLSWKVMLVPGAVITISNALNIKNSIAMEVGQNEIFRYMCSLTNPHPQPTLFDPIRDQVIQAYGPNGQDPNLVHPFQFVLEAGGKDGLVITDYQNFQELFCDPRNRKLDFSAYKVINLIPPEFPRFKLAVLLYTWKQPPVGRTKWCGQPPDFASRFEPDGKKISWLPFLKQLEAVLTHIRFVVIGNISTNSTASSVVAEKKGTAVGTLKEQTQWMLELCSSIIASLLAAPTGRKKADQEKNLSTLQNELAKLIGRKIREYYKTHWPDCTAVGATLKSRLPPYVNAISTEKEDPFWTMVNTSLCDDCKPAQGDAQTTNSNSKSTAVVAADLVPVASQMDERGRMIGSQETYVCRSNKKDKPVTIPFREWMSSKAVNEAPVSTAKRALLQCVFTVTQQLRRRVPAVQLMKQKNTISVVAEKRLEAGELVLPLFFRKSTSIVAEGDWGAEHHRTIGIDIEWTEPNVSERLADTGIEEPLTQAVSLFVKEEVRLPNQDSMSEDWTGHEDLHPFWLIKRQKEGTEINCELKNQLVEIQTTMEWDSLGKQGAKIEGLGGVTVYVWYPFIVNTREIHKDEEVVLQFDKEEYKKDKKRKAMTAFDQLKIREKDRHKRLKEGN